MKTQPQLQPNLRDSIMETPTEAQTQLTTALAELRTIATAEDAVRQQIHKLRAIGQQPEMIRRQMADAHQQHTAALADWARKGAKGTAPAAPAEMAQLAQQLADAERQALAVEQAVKELDPKVLEAQGATQRAQDVVQQALARVIREDYLPALVQAAHDATIRREAITQQLAGLGFTLDSYKPLRQYLANAAGRATGDALTGAVLAPGSAHASRQQWAELIDALMAGEAPSIPTAPPAILAGTEPRTRKIEGVAA